MKRNAYIQKMTDIPIQVPGMTSSEGMPGILLVLEV